MAPQVAWIGIGNMGRGMCKNLVEKGNLDKPLILFNRTTKRATDLKEKLPSGRSTVVSSIEEVVSKSDIIFICLGDDPAVKDTVATAIKGDVKGKLFVDCSTIHPDTTNELAKSIEEHGAHFVACPVFGAAAMAESGQLVCVLAGPASAVEKVKPYTKGVMGRANIDFSDQPQGKATHLKIIGNTFILNMVETLSEGHALAEKSGLGNDNLHQFVEIMFPGPYTAYSQRLKGGDYYKREEPLFGVDLARKDARHALSLAEAAGMKIKDVEVADSHLAVVQKHMGSRGDITGIYGAVRQEAGLNRQDWADDEEFDDPNALPAPQITTNKDGTKTHISYRFNDDGKKVKTTRRIRTTIVKETVNPRVAERRAWSKFGLEKGHAPGPSFDTTTVGENIIFRPSVTWKKDGKEEKPEKDSVKAQLKDKKVKCRICDGEHFTARCPFKDTMAPMGEDGNAAGTGGADGDDEQPKEGGLGTGGGGYVPPHLRKGAGERTGATMGGKYERDDLATLRVTNVSEFAEENDLREIFERFGRVTRVFLAKDRDTGRAKGFAFISFQERTDAAKACEKIDGYGYGHLILRVEFAKRAT